MKTEIERKFLVIGDGWREGESEFFCQGYLSDTPARTVRVRRINSEGVLTVKGPVVGASRLEFQYTIPVEEAQLILNELCQKPLIEKRRYRINHGGFVWEVDEFYGENQGLILAEIELESEDQIFPLPDWVGREVTNDMRYYNSSLVGHPYSLWKGGE